MPAVLVLWLLFIFKYSSMLLLSIINYLEPNNKLHACLAFYSRKQSKIWIITFLSKNMITLRLLIFHLIYHSLLDMSYHVTRQEIWTFCLSLTEFLKLFATPRGILVLYGLKLFSALAQTFSLTERAFFEILYNKHLYFMKNKITFFQDK